MSQSINEPQVFDNSDLYQMAFGLDTSTLDNENKTLDTSLLNFSEYRDLNKIELQEFTSSSSEDEADDDIQIKFVEIKNHTKWKAPTDLPVEIIPGYMPKIVRPIDEKTKISKLGIVQAVICRCAVISPLTEIQPLNIGTALFKNDHQPLGEVYEIFGPVTTPLYLVVFPDCPAIVPPAYPRYRSDRPEDYNHQEVCKKFKEDLAKLPIPEIKVGDSIYYVPEDEILTLPVLLDQINLLKESDVLCSDAEPAFSDDEKEREFYIKKSEEKVVRKRKATKHIEKKACPKPIKNPWNSESNLNDSSLRQIVKKHQNGPNKNDTPHTNNAQSSYRFPSPFLIPPSFGCVPFYPYQMPIFGYPTMYPPPAPNSWMHQIPSTSQSDSSCAPQHSWYNLSNTENETTNAQRQQHLYDIATQAVLNVIPNAPQNALRNSIEEAMKKHL